MTLTLALIGAVAGLASLGWNVISYLLTGSRVAIEPPDPAHDRGRIYGFRIKLASRGRAPVHIVAVTLAPRDQWWRVGRLRPVPPEPWDGGVRGRAGIDSSVPHTLEAHHGHVVFYRGDPLRQWMIERDLKMVRLQAEARLGTGSVRRSRRRVTVLFDDLFVPNE